MVKLFHFKVVTDQPVPTNESLVFLAEELFGCNCEDLTIFSENGKLCLSGSRDADKYENAIASVQLDLWKTDNYFINIISHEEVF